MPSVWIERRVGKEGVRFRVKYQIGGRESRRDYGGSFATKREALARKAWIAGELAAMRVPDLQLLAPPLPKPTLASVAEQWRLSRVDVASGTAATHRVNLNRILPRLGEKPIDGIDPADVAALVGELSSAGLARESIRKTLTTLAMALEFAGIEPNPARDRMTVKLPRAEPEEPTPPTAEHVAAVARLLPRKHRLALLWLDWSGARVASVEKTLVGDYDERRRRVRLRAATTKTRRALWVDLPADLADALEHELGAREDRDLTAPLFPGVTDARLRTAIMRACRAAGVPHFSPHDLRHRRISLLHLRGVPWARIGEQVGQRNLAVTANTYSHVLVDEAEVDYAALVA